jgi:acetyl esterase/lipase
MRLTVFALLLLAPLAYAQPKAPVPAPPGVKVERDIAYVPNGDKAQVLDVYVPEKASAKPLPLIVWVHGGGWKGGSKNGGPFAAFLNEGYAVASVEYRFSQVAPFPAQIQDCQAAVRWLRANAAKYNIDPDKFGAWGSSAGGHLVALLGTSGGKKVFPAIGGNEDVSDRVQAVCDYYGPADFTTVVEQAGQLDPSIKFMYRFEGKNDPYWSLIQAKPGPTEAKAKAVSPTTYVSKDAPPFLIFHGTADPQVPYAQSQLLADLLGKASVPVVLQRMPGVGHGGGPFGGQAVRGLVKRFFDKHLKGEDVKVEPLPEEQVSAQKKAA